jgi:peptide/nickel transport system substrate-binding protein
MRKKVLWIFLTLITVTALLLVSCQTESTALNEEGETTFITGTVTGTEPPPVVVPADTTRTEKPRYGGTITIASTTDPTAFDDAFSVTVHVNTSTLNLTNDVLCQGDWAKGPAGTHETDFLLGSINSMSLKSGALADSWEIPYRGKIIFHIREGVYWHNKAPTSGRLLTVDDVVFSLNRAIKTKGNYINVTYANFSANGVVTGDNVARTVTVECPPEEWINLIAMIPNYFSIFPKDACELWGNMNDWRHSIGTGPFMLTDYVSAGSMTFTRNPNYWETNPVGPGKGDQLPYVDSVKWLIVPDSATYWAAFRTGKIDGAGGTYTDVKEFLSNPDVKYTQYINDYCYVMFMRTDKTDLPFSKKEVRQALTMAIDFNKIVKDYYEGRATLLCWPISPIKEFEGAFVPFNEMPTNIQELFSHNVTKAKELLTQAGYPTGFSCKVLTYNSPTFTDYLSQIVTMWADIGVSLTIDARDYVTWVTRARTRNYDELINYYDSGVWQKFLNVQGVSQYNLSYINEPAYNEAFIKAGELFGFDDAALAALHKSLYLDMVENCWAIPTPNAWSYVVWWPWVKNWNGELYVGYYSYPLYMKYRWEDTDIKFQMTGKR